MTHENIIETAKVRDLQPEEKPYLRLSLDREAIDKALDRNNIPYDNDSIVRGDSYRSMWYGHNGEENEVWVSHYTVPYLSMRVFRIE